MPVLRRSRALLFNTATERLELLHLPLNRLGLTIEGTILQEAIRLGRADLQRVKLTHLQPHFYLSTGYGTVAGTTSIALGFYDCHPLIKDLNEELRGFRYSDEDIVNLVRHELGHAFAYAYKLYRRKDFRRVFNVKGNYFHTYPATNRYIQRANPWSRDFVNPSGDHYAQKHPDDDFAETFLVWIQPDYDWRYEYRNYPGALRKLEFVETVVQELRDTTPLIDQAPYEFEPLGDFKITLGQFFKLRSLRSYATGATGYIDPDLKAMFRTRRVNRKPDRKRDRAYVNVNHFISRHKRSIVAQVRRWVGVDEKVVTDLMDKCRVRADALDLWIKLAEREKKLVEFTSYISYRCALYALNEVFL